MSNVIPLKKEFIQETDVIFNIDKLVYEAKQLYSKYERNQLCLRKPKHIDDMLGITFGSASINPNGNYGKDFEVYYDNEGKIITEEYWDTYIGIFNGLYITSCVKKIEKYAYENFNYKIGRARLMRLKAKTCLTLHKDDSVVRFHVPIITNQACFFVNDNQVGRMQDIGRLYMYDTSTPHTAVNASREDRIHLLVSCYKQELKAA